MRSKRGKSGAPACISRNEDDDLVVHHQWHARNVHGFTIHWFVCEFCGMVMHQTKQLNRQGAIYDYAFIAPYTIEEMPA